jgi:hypothetical protein
MCYVTSSDFYSVRQGRENLYIAQGTSEKFQTLHGPQTSVGLFSSGKISFMLSN